MRIILAIAGIMLVYFSCGRGAAQPKSVLELKEPLPRKASGAGDSIEAAQKDAMKNARDKVTALMARHHMTSFKITDEYLLENVLVDSGKAGEDVNALPNEKPFKSWIVTFRSDPEWWRDLVRRDHEASRQLNAEARQKLGAQVIFGFALLLLASLGYARLDEYTQRKYTTWLRLGGIGVAGLLVAWIWLRTPG